MARLAVVGSALAVLLALPAHPGAESPDVPAHAAAKKCRFAPPISAKNVSCNRARQVVRRYQELVATGFCLSGNCRVGAFMCRYKEKVAGSGQGRVRCKAGRKTIRFSSG